jgi:hypothetical protein
MTKRKTRATKDLQPSPLGPGGLPREPDLVALALALIRLMTPAQRQLFAHRLRELIAEWDDD